MSALDFYAKILKTLDEIDAPYMIIGAFAGLAFGVTRATFDIDILVDLDEKHIQALSVRFPPPRYYADPEMMRDSIRRGLIFNIIDTEEGLKADFVPLTGEPEYRAGFARRIRQSFTDEGGKSFGAWCAQPTDVIIGKLKAWHEGRSAKHPADIYSMLVFTLGGLSSVQVDVDLISAAAESLGNDTAALWKELVVRAEVDARRFGNK